MEWTTEVPNADGYYWARGVIRVTVDEWKEMILLVEVDGFDLEEPEVFKTGEDMSWPISAFTHWIGPLEVPASPE